MKKSIFTISLLFLSLFMGMGCRHTPLNNPQQPIPTQTSSNSTSPIFSPFGATTTKLFSDPDADFTFEYPSTWTYKKDSAIKWWGFFYQNEGILDISGSPSFLCSSEHPRHILKINDPSTTIVEDICDDTAYIYWVPGKTIQSLKDISLKKIPENLHLIIIRSRDFSKYYEEYDKDQEESSGKFIAWVDRMAKSIKIVKNN